MVGYHSPGEGSVIEWLAETPILWPSILINFVNFSDFTSFDVTTVGIYQFRNVSNVIRWVGILYGISMLLKLAI